MMFLCMFLRSSSVNGNGTLHGGFYTEENAANAAAQTSVKETKAKASFIEVLCKCESALFCIF